MTTDPNYPQQVANLALMATIRTTYGAEIKAVCAGSTIPEAFLAALIANESGGDTNAKRFEPTVLLSLWQVLQGRQAAFGSIGGKDLLAFILPPITGSLATSPTYALQRLDSLATSWGVTQVMGYNVMPAAGVIMGNDPTSLVSPGFCLRMTVVMLKDFARRWALSPTDNAASLFRCWNAGHPDGKTADPNYVSNGLSRLAIYTAQMPIGPAVPA